MTKIKYSFNDFIVNAGSKDQAFYQRLDKLLLDGGYHSKVEEKKSGYAVSYVNSKKKNTLLNFVTRKKGILVRIYGDHTEEYMQVFESLPISMKKEIKKGQDCKRMLDEKACNPKCKMGINILLDGEMHGKCRYSALFFLIEPDKYDVIETIVKHEILIAEKI